MNYTDAIYYAKTGQALLFYGAGMAVDVKNSRDEYMPIGKSLSNIIYREMYPDGECDDLGYSSQVFIKKEGKEKLILLLDSIFSTKENPKYYKEIAKTPWRSIFTTNYDDSLETESVKLGLAKKAITSLQDPKDFPASSENIIHINGYIKNITDNGLDSNFKLTNASYLADEFVKGNWYQPFLSEVLASKAIFFVGYSLGYDFDIAKIFFDFNNSLKEKTFFITNKENLILEDFGTVYVKGVEQFAQDLSDCNVIIPENIEHAITNFEKYQISPIGHTSNKNINEATFDFFTLGNESKELLEKVIWERDYNQYAVNRVKNSNVYKRQFIFLYGDLGVGKSLFSKQLGLSFIHSGYGLYFLKESYYNPFKDIDYVLSIDKNAIFILDINHNSSDFYQLFSYLKQKIRPNDKVITCLRTEEYEKVYQEIVFQNRLIRSEEINDICIDQLEEAQFSEFLKILENNGFLIPVLNKLYPKIQNISRKKDCLYKDSNRQLNYLLLSLLKSDVILNKYKPIFKLLEKDKDKLKILSSVFLLHILGYEVSKKVLFDITEDNFITQANFKEDTILNYFFKKKNDEIIIPKSTLFAKFFFSEFQNSGLMIEVLSEIAKKCFKLKSRQGNTFPYGKVYKALATYTNIQFMFPEKYRRNSLITYYEQLRSSHIENNNPHFWLQYAIARLAYAEVEAIPHLDLAKQYLDTAIALANTMRGYKTYDLQTQLARVYIQKSFLESDDEIIYNYIIKALDNLDVVTERDKKRASFRPIKQLCDVILKNLNNFNEDKIKRILSSLSQYIRAIDASPPMVQDEPTVKIGKNKLELTIQKIERVLLDSN